MLLPNDDVLHLKDIGLEDKEIVGEELGMLGELAFSGIRFLPSFVVAPDAFANFKRESNLHIKIKHLLGSMNSQRQDSIEQTSSFIRSHIKKSQFPNKFVEKVFHEYKRLESKNTKLDLTLTAFYILKGKVIKKEIIEKVHGESALLTYIKDFWTHIYMHKWLTLKEMTHETHHYYNVAILVQSEVNPEITGYVKTIGDGKEKHQHILEANENLKLTFNKNSKKIIDGQHLSRDWHNLISKYDIKYLIEIAEKADKKLYLPYLINWVKKGSIFVTGIEPITFKTDYYSQLESIKGIPIHPGVRIGRVRIVEKNHNLVITNEEVVIVKSLTKSLFDSINRAAAIITEDELHEELKFYIRSKGIPAIMRANDSINSFRDGEIVSVDATNGEIRHGSASMS